MNLGKKEYLSLIGMVGIRIWTEKTILRASGVKLLTLQNILLLDRNIYGPLTL